MNPLPERREQAIGWILAGLMAMHLFALHPQALVQLADFAILLTGAVLRGRQIHAARWLGNTLLLLSIAAVILARERTSYFMFAFPPLLGELAATIGTILLLRPITPLRCQRVLFCLLLVLVAIILRSTAGVGQTIIVLDVAAMYLVLDESVRPSNAHIGFWVSLSRSFRVIVPVGIVVLTLFWFFPSLSVFSRTGFTSLTSFSGSDTLDAGSIVRLAQSWRVALVAHFPDDQAVPWPASIYWRGQVMENNVVFHWSVAEARIPHDNKPPAAAPPALAAGVTRYSQEIEENRGVIPVLDHAIFIKAKGDNPDVAIVDRGADTFVSVEAGSLALEAGPLALEVASSTEPLADAPDAAIQEGCLQVPRLIRDSAPIQEIVARVFARETGTPGKLHALSRYFRKSGFRYTMRPGRVQDMTKFLTVQRAGFCGHYAMAAANLLRLAGVPARVVSGYRGGEWNPWLRTITVRDSDAHAWVEAWDESSRRWLRFDPTDSVAPEIRTGIQIEMDSAKWPWYRRGWSYGRFLATETSTSVGSVWDRVTSSELWDNVPIVLFIALVGVALVWLIRNLRARRAAGPQENIARLLLDLERRAARRNRGRNPGETPLAWLDRLALAAGDAEERETLHDLARSYETGMYKPDSGGGELSGTLRHDMRRLVKLWKRQRAPAD